VDGAERLDAPRRIAAARRDPHGRVIVGYSGVRETIASRAVLWGDRGVSEIAGLLETFGVSLGGMPLDVAERVASRTDRVLVQGDGSGAWIAASRRTVTSS
jgi:hypothetical protein